MKRLTWRRWWRRFTHIPEYCPPSIMAIWDGGTVIRMDIGDIPRNLEGRKHISLVLGRDDWTWVGRAKIRVPANFLAHVVHRASADTMRDAWLNEEPTPQCFDYEPDQYCVMVDYIKRQCDDATTAVISDHLIDCVRCRHLFIVARQLCKDGLM